ncbi:MAG TPA: flagellar export chaperone FliS [Treponemataceae bacterium]|nr:flagellar export chaperone FliS [Treponemataceae bacterium]
MAYTRSYSAYKETGVKTASQGTLIVMLYTEAVKQLKGALEQFDSNDTVSTSKIEKLHTHLSKTQEIFTELMVSLDMEKGGEIAKNLMALYSFFNHTIMDVSISKNKEKISEICTMMNELREAWAIAASQASAPPPQTHPSVDING